MKLAPMPFPGGLIELEGGGWRLLLIVARLCLGGLLKRWERPLGANYQGLLFLFTRRQSS